MTNITENERMELLLTNGRLEDLISYLDDDIESQRDRKPSRSLLDYYQDLQVACKQLLSLRRQGVGQI